MRQPLWLLNGILLVLFALAWIVSLLLVPSPVKKASVTPAAEQPVAEEKEAPKVSIARIYENDLFGTYIPQPQPEVKKPEIKVQPPQPPQPQPAPSASQPEPSFLAPLEVTLKGVIFTNDESKTRAILADTKTQEETLYQVGDTLKDADIVHIGKDKVILIRSNGQQETLFITQEQAKNDPGYPTNTTTWSNVIQAGDEKNSYHINITAFTQAIPHLAYLLDELDMTTAFENGQAVGARVGKIEQDSLGTALGLQSGDIITHIDNTSTATTQNRVNIYHSILEKSAGDSITVDIRRNTSTITMTYTLHLPQQEAPEQAPATLPSKNPIREQEKTNKAVMTNGNKQKQTVDALQRSNTNAMLQRGGQENALQRG